jgi:hypothetical protein
MRTWRAASVIEETFEEAKRRRKVRGLILHTRQIVETEYRSSRSAAALRR